MNLLRSLIKRLPGGKKYLEMRFAKKYLFRSGSDSLFNNKIDQVYAQAFERIFYLLNGFYQNGLRGDILEFGVHFGYTAKLFASCLEQFPLKETRLHLLDSFEGLPPCDKEDQKSYEVTNGHWGEGILCTPKWIDILIHSSLESKLGKERVFVLKGFFDQTLEKHIAATHIKKALLVHLDCDLYSSSKYVLRTLMEHDLLQDGSLLICDDWMTSFGNPNLGQRKAVAEILEMYPNWSFEPYFNYGFGSQVFVLHDLNVKRGRRIVDENPSSCTH